MSSSRASWGWPRWHQGQCRGPSPAQGITVPREPFRTSMTYVTLSSFVPPPAGSGPAWLALQNDPGDKTGPSPTGTVGKGTERGNPPLGKPSTAFSLAKQSAGGTCCRLCGRAWPDLWQDASTAKPAVLTLLLAPTVNYLLCILQQQLNSINSLCSVFNKHHYHITSQDYANPANGIISLPKVTLIYQF